MKRLVLALALLAPATAAAAPTADQFRAEIAKARADATALRQELARVRKLQAPDVASALTLAATIYRVPRSSLSSVAACESGHRPWARNGQYRGLFQMGPMFERTPFGRAGLSVWNPYVAALATASVVSVQGWRQWECKP